MIIFIVYSEDGSYDDYSCTNIGARYTMEAAETFIEELKAAQTRENELSKKAAELFSQAFTEAQPQWEALPEGKKKKNHPELYAQQKVQAENDRRRQEYEPKHKAWYAEALLTYRACMIEAGYTPEEAMACTYWRWHACTSDSTFSIEELELL
jgi:hypothetical protein